MTLHEAIERVLNESGRPMSPQEIADEVNYKELYVKKDESLVDSGQIRLRVKNYSGLFEYLNGQVFLQYDGKWSKLLSTYKYLADILRAHFSRSDLQFVLASLIFVKRLFDLNKVNSDYLIKVPLPDDFYSYDSVLDTFLRGTHFDLNELDLQYSAQGVFGEYGRLLSELKHEKKLEVFSLISQMELGNYSEEEFGPIFEYFLHLISAEFASSTIPYTPKNIQELMVRLLRPQSGESLYDPVCGSGGLLVESLKITEGKMTAKGTEINQRMSQLCYMNLIMHGFFNVDLTTTDCLTDFSASAEYDTMIADLPLMGFDNSSRNFDLFRRWNLVPPKSGKGYSAPVLYSLSKLKPTGRAVITVSESLLFKGGIEKKIRELLIRHDYIEAIIGLPGGAFKPYTESKSAILVLNKDKPNELKEKIKFIQSKSEKEHKGLFDQKAIINAFESLSNSSNPNLLLIDNSSLKNDLSLLISSYGIESLEAKKMLSSNQGLELGDLVHIHSGTSPKRETISDSGEVRLARIENLSATVLDIGLKVNNLRSGVDKFSVPARSRLTSEAILVARIGDQLKPTYFKPSEEHRHLMLHSGVFGLTPKLGTKPLDLEYLYYQLYTDFVQRQIAANRTGAVMPHISIARLKEVVIPYGNLTFQKQFIETQRATIVSAERAKVEERIKALGYQQEVEDKETEVVRTLVHELIPKLSNIDSWVKKIGRVIIKNNLQSAKEYLEEEVKNTSSLADELERPENYTIQEVISKLSVDASHLNQVLNTVQQVMTFNLKSEDFSKVDLLEFLEDYCVGKQLDITNNYKIETSGKHCMIDLHPGSMVDLFDQLCSNAEKHGFIKPGNDFWIRFRVTTDEERGVCKLNYANNGEPFGLDKSYYTDLFEKRQGSPGSGIGGNYINRIVKAHNGKLLINEKRSSGFEIDFEIPLNHIENDE